MSKDSPKDLKVRTLSALVMIAVAGSALWAGGWVFTAFVAIVAAGLLWEWWGLISKFNAGVLARMLWMLGGLVYIGGATIALLTARMAGLHGTLNGPATFLISLVVIVDVCAYLTGRFIGGYKIAPKISPSKTWSGLIGSIIGAFIYSAAYVRYYNYDIDFISLATCGAFGGSLAVLAQSGDFFESWLKRRAGVKDSGDLIVGHGGLFDRLDGLVAVLFVSGVLFWNQTAAFFYIIRGLGHSMPVVY